MGEKPLFDYRVIIEEKEKRRKWECDSFESVTS